MNFEQLVNTIQQTHDNLHAQSAKAVNITLTLRNWLIGYYIAEYELTGADRAVYGEQVLSELATRLNGISNCNKRQLYRYLRFYRTYPQIVGTLPPQLQNLLPDPAIVRKVGTLSPQFGLPKYSILERFSYSHIEQLVDIDDENQALVEYALAGMDNSLFVSKYLLELPKKETIQAFIEQQVKEIGDNGR